MIWAWRKRKLESGWRRCLPWRRIKTNVDKETGDKIREMELAGVKVDEDFKRYYPYNELASKVIGFTGGDNQGIIGLEVRYEDYLKGSQRQDSDNDRCKRY